MKNGWRKKASRLPTRCAPSIRVKSLAQLPAEYGCADMAEFIRLFRKSSSAARPHKVHRTKKVGSTLIVRDRIETSVTKGKSAMVIALELGVSIRVVDRVMSNLERRRLKSRSKRVPGKHKRGKQLELIDLPFLFGFDSPKAFIRATNAAARQRPASTWDQQGNSRHKRIK